jgi:hypothetical protein
MNNKFHTLNLYTMLSRTHNLNASYEKDVLNTVSGCVKKSCTLLGDQRLRE